MPPRRHGLRSAAQHASRQQERALALQQERALALQQERALGLQQERAQASQQERAQASQQERAQASQQAQAVIVIDDSEDESDVAAAAAGTSNPAGTDSDMSPGFRNVAAMAGWDDESVLLLASGTPLGSPPVARHRKREARTPGHAVTPGSANRRRRKPRLPSLASFTSNAGLESLSLADSTDNARQPPIIDISDPPAPKEDTKEDKPLAKSPAPSKAHHGKENMKLDQLREELSCAVCLDLCFEPATTSCGHSFCKTCLKSVLRKCGPRCPKCRQGSIGEVSVNVVLWNTIQILFPDEAARRLELKKMESEANDMAAKNKSIPTGSFYNDTNRDRLFATRRHPFRIPRRIEELQPARAPPPAQALRAESDAEMARRLQEAEYFQPASPMDNLYRARARADRFHNR